MNRHPSKMLGVAWFAFVIIFLSIMFCASFFLTTAIFRLIHFSPSALIAQIINSFLGLFFAGLLIGSVGKIAAAKGWLPERNLFGPIIAALERIAKGDFGVRLANHPKDNQMVNLLANSVNKMALELEQMEKIRQEFISNVSHEIQSPLTSIRGFAQALQNDQLSPEERHHYLTIIETESTRLSRVSTDLLRMAVLDSEQAKLSPTAYRLDKQIRSLVLACEPQWMAKKLDISVSLDKIEVFADEDLLSQVWQNLLYNSIKFTPEGGQILLELHQHGELVRFSIQDTGIGIAQEDQERVFERFFKADKSRTKVNGGSGLGLAITKKILELHAGEIKMVSTPGTGTTFQVQIPANRKSSG
jgi:two-component system, OmpR family, phosphate regulon sensor histidine kinase PhoR